MRSVHDFLLENLVPRVDVKKIILSVLIRHPFIIGIAQTNLILIISRCIYMFIIIITLFSINLNFLSLIDLFKLYLFNNKIILFSKLFNSFII